MVIDFNSIPVYNFSYVANAVTTNSAAIFTDVFRNEPVWTCADWIAFFNALNTKYGEAKAKQIWSNWWILGLSKSAGGKGDIRAGSGLVYDSVPLDCRTLNTDFRKFIDKYKLSDVVYKGLGVITMPLGTGVDIVTNVADAVKNTSTALKYVVPSVVIGLGAIVLFWGYGKFIK